MRNPAHIAYGVGPTDAATAHADGESSAFAVPRPGEILDGKYRIEGTLGQGGMAIVLAATHLHLEERVAIKLLLPQWAEDPEFIDRFMREGRSAIKIRSEHVVRVLDVGVVEARPYLVMEYLEGSDLDALIATGGPLPVSVAVDYLLQACEAIAEAHASGIIHRDLKPANLFLTHRADGSPCMKVLDFGISKLMNGPRNSGFDMRTTQPSMVMGSPHYMSPEQMASARDVDERTDIWAIGAILHELIAGAPPFKGDTMTALCATILKDPPPPLTTLRADVPHGLEAIVARCLKKEPAARYANVADLAAALAEFGSPAARASAERIRRVLDAVGDTQTASPWSVPPTATRPRIASLKDSLAPPPGRRRGHVFGYVVGAVALVAVGSGIGFMIVRNDHAARASALREESVQLSNAQIGATNGAPAAAVAPPASPLPTGAATGNTSAAHAGADVETPSAPRPSPKLADSAGAGDARAVAQVPTPPHKAGHGRTRAIPVDPSRPVPVDPSRPVPVDPSRPVPVDAPLPTFSVPPTPPGTEEALTPAPPSLTAAPPPLPAAPAGPLETPEDRK